jgi:hypothetical protein
MVQRIRPKEVEDSKLVIDQQLSNFEKVERDLRDQERRERANQLGMPGLVLKLQ